MRPPSDKRPPDIRDLFRRRPGSVHRLLTEGRPLHEFADLRHRLPPRLLSRRLWQSHMHLQIRRAEALRLMKESGAGGSTVVISCREVYVYMCEFLDTTMRGLGLAPRIDAMDLNRLNEITQPGRHQMTIAGTGTQGLPGTPLTTFVTTNPLNSDKHGDTKVDDFQKKILSSIDPVERRNTLWEAERYILVDKVYDVVFYRTEAVIAYRTYIKGAIVPGWQVHDNNDRATDWIDKSLR